ncbi:Hypothetical protein D9617_1g083920 [Elsinoe fawcettii]|nr:Hypothetical protein D9617_1g083920 [Elsinoe fawcettii]
MDISSIDDIDFTISDQEWPDQLMVDDFPTFDTPLSAFDSLSDESSNTTNTNITPHTMDVEFDALFALPDSPKPDQSFNSSMTRQSNSVAPQAPMMSATVERRPWPSRSHQHRPSSSTSRLSTQLPPPSPFHSESSSSMSSINSPRMTRRPNGPQRRTSTQPCNKSHNEYRCLSTALKLLESAHSCPKERAQVNELFRFLREIKRHIASLTALMLCPQCTKASTYLTLLSSIVSKLVLGLNETSQILTNRAIETSSSAGFDDYGVDTADEFAEMYANLTLSHLSDMRSLIAELGHKAAQEKWKVPYENLRLADSRLGTLEQEMQSFRPDKRVG